MMKRIFLMLLVAVTVLPASAQRDVTKFLGIPVDGTKAEMRKKLIAKGFMPTKIPGCDFLEGEFNGRDVHVYIKTNNNKVYRIFLTEARMCSEADVKVQFNNLVSQFERNERYMAFDNYHIEDDVDISYEMTVKNKNFDAVFYQQIDMDEIDTLTIQTQLRKEMLKKYTEEQLANPTEDIETDTKFAANRIAVDLIEKKCVWFRICREGAEYFIAMYYDNEYNHANGEDL